MVQTIFDSIRLFANILLLLALTNSSRLFQQTLLLLSLGLWLVLVEKFEGLSGGVAVEHVGELGDRRWDFETEVEDLLLALQANVFGPLYHAREVATGLDVLADTEVAWTLFDEGVLRNVRGFMSPGTDWSWSFIVKNTIDGIERRDQHTLAVFLVAPALLWGKGAGAAFLLCLGGCH